VNARRVEFRVTWMLLLCATVFLPRAAAAQPLEELARPAFYGPEADLRAYVDEAVGRHPRVREALARYRSALQTVPQANALPDPMFTFTQAIRSVETRVGPQLNTFMYTQAFPWFGTLALRERVAVQAAVAQYHQYVAAQRDVIARVKQAYYDLGYIDTALLVTEQEQSLLEHYEQLAQTRFATGQGLQQGVIRLQAEITQVINRLEMLRQQRATLAARLNTLRDRAPEALVPTVAPVPLPAVALDLEALYALGDQYRPELHAGTALIERSERSVALARNASRPNFTVGVGYQNVLGRRDPVGRLMPPPDNGKNSLTVSLGLTIPLWAGKNRATLEQAGEDLMAQRHGYAAARNTMEFDVRDAVIRLQTLRDQIDLFEQVLIPQTEETLRATEAAYETAQLGVLDLLDSERMQLDVRLVTARYSADYLVTLADLERAIGTTVPLPVEQ